MTNKNDSVSQEKDIPKQKKNFSQALIAVFILTAAVFVTLIVTGNDIFSPVDAHKQKDVVESTHILRNERETFIKFRLKEFDGVTQIAFPENYLSQFKIKLVYPQPQYKQYIQGNIIYTYNAEDAEMVTFYLEPRKTGRIKGSLLVGDKSHTLSHLVYP